MKKRPPEQTRKSIWTREYGFRFSPITEKKFEIADAWCDAFVACVVSPLFFIGLAVYWLSQPEASAYPSFLICGSGAALSSLMLMVMMPTIFRQKRKIIKKRQAELKSMVSAKKSS